MLHLMIDLETLGTRPGCAIKQIGWAVFDPAGPMVVKSGNIHVDLESCQAAGLKIDASTMLWWLQQSAQARAEMLKGGKELAAALGELQTIYQELRPAKVWANSPSFDLCILDACFEKVGLKAPWKFWDQEDLRTLRTAVELRSGQPAPRPPKGSDAHVAEADAKAQAEEVIRMVALLRA